jgi:hypothetical protein
MEAITEARKLVTLNIDGSFEIIKDKVPIRKSRRKLLRASQEYADQVMGTEGTE